MKSNQVLHGLLLFFLTSSGAVAAFGADMQMAEHADLNGSVMTAEDCAAMEVYDTPMAMCMPLPMKDMAMTMLMIHGNGFITEIAESGARGRTALASTNMVMADLGTSVGEHHYLNLDFMGTIERWTVPDLGYPELLQIGEENNSGLPYLDAQHPHSSPVMGLTLSDTIGFERKQDSVKIFAAPRGEATDGPIAFMHRATGVVNPNAPLGHHIGQDVGHITSSVIGESLKWNDTRFEFSTYHGAEPKPQNVDLPLGALDSYSMRLIEEFAPSFMLMASYAYVSSPEADAPDISFENRYSASLYNSTKLSSFWKFDNTFIWGAVSDYDHASTLTSFAEEFLFTCDVNRIWGRLEILQRTPAELQVTSTADNNAGQWVSALTLGYTYQVASISAMQLALGASLTADLLPQDFQATYSGNPWSANLFLQISGMKMWSL